MMAFKVRMVLFAFLAVFVSSAVSASVAAAQEGPVWHVNGAVLKSGENDTIVDKNVPGTTAKLVGKVASAEVVIVCKKVTSSGSLIGGNPGKNKEIIEFTECEITNVEGCSVAVAPTRARSILGHVPGSSKMLVDFGAEEGTRAFTEITISKKTSGCTLVTKAPVTVAEGDTYAVAAEISPEEAQTREGLLHFPETAIKEDEQEGKTVKLGLVFDKNPAVFSAQINVEQLSKLPFGAFQK